MKAINDINDPRLVKALAHPLRVRILAVLQDRVASPSDLADELNAPLGNVSYHVRILAQLELLKLVKKRPRRGAIEHYYEARSRVRVTDRAWGQVPKIVKEAMVNATLDQVSAYVEQSARVGGFERAEAHLSRNPLRLDSRGWQELSKRVDELLEEAHRIEVESVARLKQNEHRDEIEAGLVMMLFEGVAGGIAPEADSAAEQHDGARGKTSAGT
jgi:DNA-binding transcriptional ArsR family regulator